MATAGTDDIRAALRTRLRESLVARDRPAMQVLRSALAAIENAEAHPVGDTSQTELVLGAAQHDDVDRRIVTEDDARAIVASEVAELDAAAEEYDRLDEQVAAAAVRHQAGVLRAVLDPRP